MTFGSHKPCKLYSSYIVDKSISQLSDIWSRRTFSAYFDINTAIKSLDPVLVVSSQDLDCMSMSNGTPQMTDEMCLILMQVGR